MCTSEVYKNETALSMLHCHSFLTPYDVRKIHPRRLALIWLLVLNEVDYFIVLVKLFVFLIPCWEAACFSLLFCDMLGWDGYPWTRVLLCWWGWECSLAVDSWPRNLGGAD